MPWIELGISRATYYRRRARIKNGETADTETRPLDRRSCITTNKGGAAPVGTYPEVGGSAEAIAFIGQPLSPSFRVDQRLDQAKIDPIAGLENVAADIGFRGANYEINWLN